jgi:hypothetical protein
MMSGIGTSFAKFDMMKFDRSRNFGLWQRRVKDLLVEQEMVKALYGTKPEGMADIVIGVKYCLLDPPLLMFVRLLAALITNILYSF